MSGRTNVSLPEFFGFQITEQAERVGSGGAMLTPRTMFVPSAAGVKFIVSPADECLRELLKEAESSAISPIEAE